MNLNPVRSGTKTLSGLENDIPQKRKWKKIIWITLCKKRSM